MPSIWMLTVGTVAIDPSDLDIETIARSRRSQAADQLLCALPGVPITQAAPAIVGDPILLSRDGAPWFVGRVTALRQSASGTDEGWQLQAAGPWWYLDNLVYQQVWHIYGGGDVTKSHCLLNTWADGTRMGIRDQIDDALAWVSAKVEARFGVVPFVWAKSEFPDAQIPADEVRDITVGEVIRKQLRWVPDAVTWFDYTTTPPTFHCARRAQLAARALGISDGISAVSVQPRNDLVVPSVVIKYERSDTIDGVVIPSLSVDAAPSGADGTEFGALCATVDLQGFSVSFARAVVVAAALPAAGDSAAWWAWMQSKERWLMDNRVQLLQIVSISREHADAPGLPLLPRELVAGQITDWMTASSQAETVTIEARIQMVEGADADEVVTRRFTASINTTDATTGEYSQAQSVQGGEVAPVGLAQVIFDSLRELDYEGSVSLLAEEIPADGEAGGIGIGQRINILGLRPEWASMNAMVQEVSEDVGSGQRTIRFGPPQHLGPRDLVELLRVNRFRLILTPASTRAGADTSTLGVGLGRTTPKENSNGGTMSRERLVLRGSGAGRIVLDSGAAGTREIAVREVAICHNGAERRMLIVASEPYDA